MTRRRFLRLFTVAFLGPLVLLGSPASSADAVTLKGSVSSKNGAPMGSARIEFEPGGYVAVSSRNGRFAVRGFIPGSYSVTVREGGKYQTFKKEIGSTVSLQVNW